MFSYVRADVKDNKCVRAVRMYIMYIYMYVYERL